MGTQNKRFGAIRDLSLIESRRMQLQTAIDNSKSIESRRRFGQFATPYELAQEIMSFGLTLQDKKEISFLEPAFGTGAFYSALLSECDKHAKTINTAIGVEVDKDFFAAANELLKKLTFWLVILRMYVTIILTKSKSHSSRL